MMELNVKFTLSAIDSVELMCNYMGQEKKGYTKQRFLQYAKKSLEAYGIHFCSEDFNKDGSEPTEDAWQLILKYKLIPQYESR